MSLHHHWSCRDSSTLTGIISVYFCVAKGPHKQNSNLDVHTLRMKCNICFTGFVDWKTAHCFKASFTNITSFHWLSCLGPVCFYLHSTTCVSVVFNMLLHTLCTCYFLLNAAHISVQSVCVISIQHLGFGWSVVPLWGFCCFCVQATGEKRTFTWRWYILGLFFFV